MESMVSLFCLVLVVLPSYISTTRSHSFPSPCCTDQDGKSYLKCTCLENNILQRDYHLSKGKTLHLHWRLTDLQLANVHDSQRPTIKLHTLACWGQMATHVKGLAIDFPNEKTAWYSHDGTNGHSELKFPFIHSSYMISVESKLGGNFSIVATTEHNDIPVPGDSGNIGLTQISENSIEVKWVEADSLVPVKYELYYNLFDNINRIRNVSIEQLNVCRERGTTMGPCDAERAIMNTPCGCRRNGILSSTVYQAVVASKPAEQKKRRRLNTGDDTNIAKDARDDRNQPAVALTASNTPKVYRAVINDLPLHTPIFVNVLAIPTALSYKQYEVAYKGRSISLSFDRVVSVFDETMIHVYIAASVYGLVGILFIVASIQKSRIHSFVQIRKIH
jgi:hypothetical protein